MLGIRKRLAFFHGSCRLLGDGLLFICGTSFEGVRGVRCSISVLTSRDALIDTALVIALVLGRKVKLMSVSGVILFVL